MFISPVPTTAMAIGIRIPKVPHKVPVENANPVAIRFYLIVQVKFLIIYTSNDLPTLILYFDFCVLSNSSPINKFLLAIESISLIRFN